jgi:hypothetical protein
MSRGDLAPEDPPQRAVAVEQGVLERGQDVRGEWEEHELRGEAVGDFQRLVQRARQKTRKASGSSASVPSAMCRRSQ